MGCGSGAVSMAAATEYPGARILAVDSDTRAIESTQISATLNGITSVETLLNSAGQVPEPGTWDLLLANPPYYSDYRISELFLQAAKNALRPAGRGFWSRRRSWCGSCNPGRSFRNAHLNHAQVDVQHVRQILPIEPA